MKILRLFSMLAGGMVLLGGACALPVRNVQQSFVPKKEVLAVELAKEGATLFAQGRFVEAELSIRQALWLQPDSRTLRLNLSSALEQSGQFEEAKAILKELLTDSQSTQRYRSRPGDPLIYQMHLAHLLYSEQRYTEAQKWYEQSWDSAVTLNKVDEMASVARSLSALHFKVGNESEALSWSGIALQVKGGGAELEKHLRLLLALNRVDEALHIGHAYEDRINLRGNPNIVHFLAMANYARGNYKDAFSQERIVIDSEKADSSLGFEISLVRVLASEHLTLTEPQTKEIAALRTQLVNLFPNFNKALSLYWPPELLRALDILSASPAAQS